VLPTDLERLYAIAVAGVNLTRWRFRGRQPSPKEFAERLWPDTLSQFVILPRHVEQVIGLVAAYGHNERDRHAYLGIVVDPQYHGLGWPLEAAALCIEHLFRAFDLRRVYVEATSGTLSQFDLRRVGPWRHLAVIPEHEFVGGRYEDLHLFMLDRGDFEQTEGDHLHRATGLGALSDSRRPFDFTDLVGVVAELGYTPDPSWNELSELSADCGIDSLGVLELLAVLEDRTGKVVPGHALGQIRTLGDVLQWCT
jgi:RimJ/RimL family protein N-acetyltransferase/acyl carrier protein